MAESSIGATLERMLRTLGLLEQALSAEADILTKELRDPESISAIAQKKQQLVAEINELVRETDRHLAAQGLPSGYAGLENWLASLPKDDAARELWQSVMDATLRCKDRNETNGVQISLLNRRTRDALSVLLGDLGGAVTYGPDGGAGRIVPTSQSSYKA